VTHFLYVVRHGQADPHDGPLSPAGAQQARLTGQRLKDVPFSGIYHGPLPRAAQTASLIAACLPRVPRRGHPGRFPPVPCAPAVTQLPGPTRRGLRTATVRTCHFWHCCCRTSAWMWSWSR
jgi:broad specificity phosphatase PhoE